jgi:hypothetical protein
MSKIRIRTRALKNKYFIRVLFKNKQIQLV